LVFSAIVTLLFLFEQFSNLIGSQALPKWNNVEPVKSLEDNLYTEGEIMGYHRCENCGKMFTLGMCNIRAIASVRNAAPKWEQPKKKKNTGKQGKSKCRNCLLLLLPRAKNRLNDALS
jgi:hypothetical protein